MCRQCKGKGTVDVPSIIGAGITVPCGLCNSWILGVSRVAEPAVQSKLETIRYINEAWRCLRMNNHSIPDEVLDFIRDSALEALNKK